MDVVTGGDVADVDEEEREEEGYKCYRTEKKL